MTTPSRTGKSEPIKRCTATTSTTFNPHAGVNRSGGTRQPALTEAVSHSNLGYIEVALKLRSPTLNTLSNGLFSRIDLSRAPRNAYRPGAKTSNGGVLLKDIITFLLASLSSLLRCIWSVSRLESRSQSTIFFDGGKTCRKRTTCDLEKLEGLSQCQTPEKTESSVAVVALEENRVDERVLLDPSPLQTQFHSRTCRRCPGEAQPDEGDDEDVDKDNTSSSSESTRDL